MFSEGIMFPDHKTVRVVVKAKTKSFSVVDTSKNSVPIQKPSTDGDRHEQLAELGVTGKAFSILEVVSLNPEPTTMAEIIRTTGITKPTAHRIVNLLVDMRFLERSAFDRGFIEGASLVSLAHRTLVAAAPRSLRHSILQGISDEVGETCNYGVLSGGEVIYLCRVEAKWPLGLRFDAGSRVPAHCTAIGKLLLSRLPDSELLALIDTMPRSSYTANTITEAEPLLAALKEIRRDGIGTDDQEFMHGVVCVAVPVMGDDGRCLGGIAISAPEARMTLNEVLGFVSRMKEAAERLATTYRHR
jgi:IclR family transcriptional regulator, acetate operon repressor